MFSKTAVRQTYISTDNPTAIDIFSDALLLLINKGLRKGCKSVVFVCIGTDRATGDCLGPLIGYKINNLKYNNVHVHGCLENPVHAKNIDNVIKYIYANYDSPYIVAIDACLGRMDHVGYITVGEGSIKPGSGVNKDLSPVGDIYITGIVNFGGFMDFLVLQNTRLNLVMKMADIISTGIRYVLWKINNDSSESISSCNIKA